MSRKLLLADASVTIQRVIELTFAGEDVQVVSVSDGEQAIHRIPLERPDIVLADIGMPKRNGYEVAAFVKQHPQFSHVPVLLLAGAFNPVDETRARQVRADGILVKPFEPQQVIARVRELMDARAGTRDPGLGTRDPGLTTRESGVGIRGSDLSRVPDVESRRANVESRVPDPEFRVPGPEPEATSLDDYFERLDASFATLGPARTQPPAPAAAAGRDDRSTGTTIPTIEDLLSGVSLGPEAGAPAPGRVAPPPAEQQDASSTLSASPRPHETPPPSRGNALAQAFTLFLSVEQGELDSEAIRIGPVSPQIEITDELVDRIARRVLERLAPETARTLVAEIVSDIAERLVREEIERIKRGLRA